MKAFTDILNQRLYLSSLENQSSFTFFLYLGGNQFPRQTPFLEEKGWHADTEKGEEHAICF